MKPSGFSITGTKAVISSPVKSQTTKTETKTNTNKPLKTPVTQKTKQATAAKK